MIKKINQNSFSMLIAPYIHEDTKESAEWYKYKEKLDIKTLTINTFINYLEKKYTLENFLKS